MRNKVTTKEELRTIFKRLSIKEGDIILVQSLSTDQKLLGGAEMVIDLILEMIGKEGTLVVSLAGYNKEPGYVLDHRKNDIKLSEFRENMPPYNERTASTYARDYLALNMMMRKGVEISNHHSYPFAALGAHATAICNHQSLDFPLGKDSPMARLYELQAKVLLINVGLIDLLSNQYVYQIAENTSIRMNGGITATENNQWVKYLEYETNEKEIKRVVNDSHFKSIFRQIEFHEDYYVLAELHDVVNEFKNEIMK